MELSESNKIIITSTFESFYKSTFGQIPFIGTPLIEMAYEYSGRIQQKRLNVFNEMLIEYFEKVNKEDINIDNIKTENFHDFFNSILKRVVTTKSEEKMRRFRQILINGLNSSNEIDFSETFLDITSRLNEEQIEILFSFGKIWENQSTLYHKNKEMIQQEEKLTKIFTGEGKIGNITKELEDIRSAKQRIDNSMSEFDKYSKANHYNDMDDGLFQFYVQDLVSKSLLMDIGSSWTNINSYSRLMITDFGMAYLEFIEEN